MEFGNISNNSFGLNTNFSRKVGLNSNLQKNNSAYYAKKGEPMYLKEMDADEDGIVSFDEFKDYCKEQWISAKEMVKMVEMANSYRTMQSQKKTTKNIHVIQHDKKTLKTTSKSHIRIHTHKLMLNITTTSQVHKTYTFTQKKEGIMYTSTSNHY